MSLSELVATVGVIFLLPLAWSQPVCPYMVKQNCLCISDSVACENLSTFPPLSTGDTIKVTKVYFSSCTFTTVPSPGQGQGLPPSLISLTFNNVSLVNLSSEALNGSATTLRNLTLRHTDVEELPSTLLFVANLTALTISDTTNINTWNNTILEHIGKTITYLDLQSTRLPDFKFPAWFSNFSQLVEVDLSSNSISTIPDDAFNAVNSSLKILRLNTMLLKDVGNSFEGLSLTDLSLNGNVILGDLNRSLSYLTKTLQYLNLGINFLEVIPPTIGLMQRLTILDFSVNRLTDIEASELPVGLRELYVQGNNISHISNTSFLAGAQLQIINLSDNPIVDISPEAFQSTPSVRILSLQGTALTTIPVALTKLTRVEQIDLRYIRNPICTCPRDERLVTWFKSLPRLNLLGDCNNGHDIAFYLTDSGKHIICAGCRLCPSLIFSVSLFCFLILLSRF